MSYQNLPAIDEDETTVLVVTTSTPPPTSTNRSSQWRVARVAGMLLLLLLLVMVVAVGGGGMVGRKPEESLLVDTAAGLVGSPPFCYPRNQSNFEGTSVSTYWGKGYAFETCYKLENPNTHHDAIEEDGRMVKYCWSASYYEDLGPIGSGYYQCLPYGDGWKALEFTYKGPTRPGVHCGKPCQRLYKEFHS